MSVGYEYALLRGAVIACRGDVRKTCPPPPGVIGRWQPTPLTKLQLPPRESPRDLHTGEEHAPMAQPG